MATFAWRALTDADEQTWAQGGHVEQPTPMCDVLEITAPIASCCTGACRTWSTLPASAARSPI